jgi:hypothetical protein
MSNEVEELGEGHSPAAWSAVVIMLVAVTIGTVAFVLDIPWIVWASAGLLVVGFFVGVVLAKLGYGVGGSRYVPKEH